MNEYYIYIYLDPRKPGKYKYVEYEFKYEPFYVGKGKNGRWKDISDRSEYFKNKINKIKKSGLKPLVIKLKENLNEEILTQKEIGEKFGVCQVTISAIKTRKIWKHIKLERGDN